MKEKSKNILKTLGVGTLCLFGSLAFSGCSTSLNQGQIDKLMYAVENSQQFMQDTLDLLGKQNAKIDSYEAYQYYRYAINKFYLNIEGVRDNVVISIKMNNYEDTIKTYKKGNICACSSDDEEVLKIEENGISYSCSLNNNSIETKEIDDWNIDSGIEWKSVDVLKLTGIQFEEQHIVACNILENGNYELIAVIENHEEGNKFNSIFSFEFTSNGNFVNKYNDCFEHHNFDGKKCYENNVKYGIDAEFENLVNKACEMPMISKILSSSMMPALNIGDRVEINAKDTYSVGDIIKFNTKVSNFTVIHRIVGIVENDGETYYVCHGDAVATSDPSRSGQVLTWQQESEFIEGLTYEQIVGNELIDDKKILSSQIQIIEFEDIEGVATLIQD